MTEELSNYKSRAARALVLLHEKHLDQCLEVWRQAKAANIKLPKTDEEHYQSLETLLGHILGAAGDYMFLICSKLELSDPGFEPVPEANKVEEETQGYLEHLLERWRLPLVEIDDEQLVYPEYAFDGGTHHHCIDIMLQHAVMHPIRHEFQLKELTEQQTRG